jgi:hypothetical protein
VAWLEFRFGVSALSSHTGEILGFCFSKLFQPEPDGIVEVRRRELQDTSLIILDIGIDQRGNDTLAMRSVSSVSVHLSRRWSTHVVILQCLV